jgi:hypothetical protein
MEIELAEFGLDLENERKYAIVSQADKKEM